MRQELAEIEEERRRLEKEDYLVRQSDVHFYDFDEMKVTDSAWEMNLNLTWSRRLRRCDAAPPRRRRHGRQRVSVPRRPSTTSIGGTAAS